MDLNAYTPVLLHGTLPLIRDVASGRIRFARLGVDAPENCVTSATQLPDAAFTLHIFDDVKTRNGWVMAANRFGGNVIETCIPDSTFTAAIALEIDHSKSLPHADSLDETVNLIYEKGTNPEALMAHIRRSRGDSMDRNMLDLGRRAWEAAWRDDYEILSAAGCERERPSAFTPLTAQSPLSFRFPGRFHTSQSYVAERDDNGYVISWTWYSSQRDDDLQQELIARMDELGIFPHKDNVGMRFETLSKDAIAHLQQAHKSFSDLEDDLRRRQKLRNHVTSALTNDKMMTILRRARAGSPIVTEHLANPGMQVNPKTGTPQTAPNIHFRSALRDGWLVIAYPGDKQDNASFPKTRSPIVLTLSTAGKALCDGNTELAVQLVEPLWEQNKFIDPRRMTPSQPLLPSILAANTWLDDKMRHKLAQLVSASISTSDDAGRILQGHSGNMTGWSLIAAGIATGCIGMDENSRFEIRDDGRSFTI